MKLQDAKNIFLTALVAGSLGLGGFSYVQWQGNAAETARSQSNLTQQVERLEGELEQQRRFAADAEQRAQELFDKNQQMAALLEGIKDEKTDLLVHLRNLKMSQVDSGNGIRLEGALSFEDIDDHPAEDAIETLARLGIFSDERGEKFRPEEVISRGEFTRWLVRANNAYYSHDPARVITPAEGERSDFLDVAQGDRDFTYVQGLYNAGYEVMFEDGTFRPQRVLSRQEMLALKVPVDYGGKLQFKPDAEQLGLAGRWSDLDGVDPRNLAALLNDCYMDVPNVRRVYGLVQEVHPNARVTRAEAARCLYRIGRFYPVSAAQALERQAGASLANHS